MFGTKFEDIFGFVKDTDNGSGKQPSSDYMFKCLIILQTLCAVWWLFVAIKGKGGMRPLIKDFGVRLRRVKKVAGEIERKMFHLSGVGVPLLWLYLQFQLFCDKLKPKMICANYKFEYEAIKDCYLSLFIFYICFSYFYSI